MSFITNDGFWHDIESVEFIASLNAPSSFEENTLDYLLSLSIVKTNRDLKAVKTAIISVFATFSAYVAGNAFDTINDVALPEFHYKNAVYAHAKYQSLLSFPQLGMTATAEKLADLDEPMKNELLNMYKISISYLFSMAAISYPDDETLTDSGIVGVYLI